MSILIEDHDIQTMSDDEAFDVGRSKEFAFEEVVQKAPTVEDVAGCSSEYLKESDVIEAWARDDAFDPRQEESVMSLRSTKGKNKHKGVMLNEP